jgi:phosphoglycolate phosphatase
MDSIIFDLDGTLWDSTGSVVNLWNQTLSKYKEVKGFLTVDNIRNVSGLEMHDIAAKFFPYLKEEKRLEIVEDCGKNECAYLAKHGGILYGRLEETLNNLSKKYKLFIVSNCQSGYIESFLKFHKLHKYFTDFECPGNTGLTKGENIKLIIKRNNLNNPVYVGDTELDLKSARYAGIPFIYARYGFGKVKEYDYVIDSFDELLKQRDI